MTTTTSTTTTVAVTGTITGTVRDVTGAVLPGVQVQVRAGQSGSVSSTLTDSQGRYTVSGLALGAYTVTVGSTAKMVTLTSSQPVTVNFP